MIENPIGTVAVDGAVELHRDLRPGLPETVYEATLAKEAAMFFALCCLLLAAETCFAQGSFEAPLSGSFGGTGGLVAGIGYFRVIGTTVDYQLSLGSVAESIHTRKELFHNGHPTNLQHH
ncbi:MAG TPA: hypothetical protein P5555_21235 [Candidatus Paceibacterota bacterium]|nr:hypothetical protein [Candidatus Paceibacterota bacterium]